MTGPGFGQTSLFPPEPAPTRCSAGSGWQTRWERAAAMQAGCWMCLAGRRRPGRTGIPMRSARRWAARPLPGPTCPTTPRRITGPLHGGVRRGISASCPHDDPDYPLAFSRIPDMPLVLYCTGDPLWLNEPGAVGMVGSRRPTEYGLQAAADLGSGLAKNGAIIVSGLADGLDSAGHRAAVKNDCPTIAVMGVPIDRTYPAANAALRQKIERKGCVISEYPPCGEGVGPNGFLQRNRLIAALSSAVLVVEAREKSGTMSTVAHAERYGKPVYAVPGSISLPNSAGTNGLLRDGRARAVAGAADLLAALGLHSRQEAPAAAKQPAPLSDTERRVLAGIGPKPVGIEELCVSTGLPMSALLGTLMKLELTGRVYKQPGQRYVLR